MKRWVTEGNAHDLQIAVHAIGDRANDQVLAIYESIPNGHGPPLPHRARAASRPSIINASATTA